MISSSIHDVPGNNLPRHFSLEQNYPYPFNPSTTIVYTIADPRFVSLKVYNFLGKEIQTVVDEQQPVAQYVVKFDASNLSSGIYFYTLKAGNNCTETRKMLFVR